MVPGEFKTLIPYFNAKPLRGRTWASYPAGSSMNNPVGMSFRSNDFKTKGSFRFAQRSIPAESPVLYSGRGCSDLLIILIFIRFYPFLLRKFQDLIFQSEFNLISTILQTLFLDKNCNCNVNYCTKISYPEIIIQKMISQKP